MTSLSDEQRMKLRYDVWNSLSGEATVSAIFQWDNLLVVNDEENESAPMVRPTLNQVKTAVTELLAADIIVRKSTCLPAVYTRNLDYHFKKTRKGRY